MKHLIPAFNFICLCIILSSCSPADDGESSAVQNSQVPSSQPQFSMLSGNESFSVIVSGTRVGQLELVHDDISRVEYEYRNNGRGPTINESIEFDEDGFPVNWVISGNATMGNAVEENFHVAEDQASWTDSTGNGAESVDDARLYVAQGASPYALWIYARLLLNEPDNQLQTFPAGELRLDEIETLEISGNNSTEQITVYALSGIDLNPDYLALDASGNFFATMSPTFALVKAGYESAEEQLRQLAEAYSAQRFEIIQQRVTRNLEGPVRINNVRIFNPQEQALSALSSVLVEENRIITVEDPVTETDDETVIEGNGGTLVAGMYEMHGHINQENALLNVAAGVTSVRDMGNNNAVLSELIEKFESGQLIGPRVTRSGFIEGASPFNSNTGVLVSTEAEALEAVRNYADGDYYQIKIYNSMRPEWIPAVIAEARTHDLRVAGHVPAFTNADAMIEAGYDELTHINQVVLGWVLEPEEDTRTLLRLTGLKRLPQVSIDDPAVQQTISAMVERGVAVDPTLAVHEKLMLSRDGTTHPGVVDYVDHMPITFQRASQIGSASIPTPADDEAYRLGFAKLLEVLTEMHDRGIFIVPGTDQGGWFPFHRELELYQQVGMTSAEVLKRATYDMAEYLGQGEDLGSIEAGKLADFFLIPGDPVADIKAIKTISMVVKDGVFYFPSEIFPEFGIQPFTEVPEISYPD